MDDNSIIASNEFFLPPANEVCEGYVFTGVCLSTPGGGVRGFIWGGMHGFIRGGGMRGFIWGVHGFISGGMCGFIRGGHAWFFQFFSDTMRYGQ